MVIKAGNSSLLAYRLSGKNVKVEAEWLSGRMVVEGRPALVVFGQHSFCDLSHLLTSIVL
jgi:hypothetical protein